MNKIAAMCVLTCYAASIAGCALMVPFLPRICGDFDVLKQSNFVAFAVKQDGKLIRVGMTKEQVRAAWGEPLYDDFAEQRWRYKGGPQFSYLLIFDKNTIIEIEEYQWERKYECRANDL